jgi:hypothetical protein
MQIEPLHVSARFHAAVATAARELERQAAQDERQIQSLIDADHRRRQRMLVDEQLLKAFRLREMLKQMLVRADVRLVPVQREPLR